MSSARAEQNCYQQAPVGSIFVIPQRKLGFAKMGIIWDIKILCSTTRKDRVYSPIFIFETLGAWRLVFVPKGNDQDNQLTSSIRLENMSKFGNFLAQFVIHTFADARMSDTGIRTSTFSTSRLMIFCGRNSCSEYISIGNFSCAKQFIFALAFTTYLDIDDLSPLLEKDIYNGQKRLLKDFAKFFAKEKHSDVILRVEGREIKAHKNILSARSPVFDSMFSNEMIENNDNIVEISDMSYESMLKFVIFLYSGKIDDFSFELAFELLSASDKYMIEDLNIVCSEFLSKSLTVKNCLDVLLLADIHCNAELKKKAMNCFCDNFKQVCETTDWQSRINCRPQLAVEFLSILAKKA